MIKRIIAILVILTGSSGIHDTTFAMHAKQQELAENPVNIVGSNGCMTIDNYGDSRELTFTVYSITGQIVKSVSVANGSSMTINLPKGFYIVKCDYWSRKVVVK